MVRVDDNHILLGRLLSLIPPSNRSDIGMLVYIAIAFEEA